jgi:hypothetical protein
MQSSAEVPVNLLAPSLDLVLLTVAAFALLTVGVAWVLRRVWRRYRLTRAGSPPHVKQRLNQLETQLRSLEDSTDYIADTLRVPPLPRRDTPVAPRHNGGAR